MNTEIRDQILDLPIQEIEKMNLLSQLEADIAKKQHYNAQKWFWIGIVILGIVAQIIAYLSVR